MSQQFEDAYVSLSDWAVESLARETHFPTDKVREIYLAELAKLEQSARIKTFLPILAHRRVKEIFRSQRHDVPGSART